MSAKERPGFMLYHSLESVFNQLPDEQIGALVRAMMQYSRCGALPEFGDNTTLNAVWPLVVDGLNRDSKRYEKVVQKKSSAATYRWEIERGKTNLPFKEWIREQNGMPYTNPMPNTNLNANTNPTPHPIPSSDPRKEEKEENSGAGGNPVCESLTDMELLKLSESRARTISEL